jgi:hypothetical protein
MYGNLLDLGDNGIVLRTTEGGLGDKVSPFSLKVVDFAKSP